MDALAAFSKADFDWVVHLDEVWHDPAYDVPALHQGLRREIVSYVEKLADEHSPLGRIILGPGGSGKTHLLAALRKEAFALDIAFVLVDMTDVHDFYRTVLLGYINSLLQADLSGRPQFRALLARTVDSVGAPEPGDTYVGRMARCGREKLVELSDIIVRNLHTRFPAETLPHQDVVRALLLMNAEDLETQSIGYSWLQGGGIDDEDKERFHFGAQERPATDILRGLSWFMSLHGPTLLALDQLDAIVGQHHLMARGEEDGATREGEHASQAIILGIGGGLAGLHDMLRRTLVVVSCLEPTVDIIGQHAPTSFLDRYRKREPLAPLERAETAQAIVAARLAPAFAEAEEPPPYPTWPFTPEAFAATGGLLPRDILKRCETHRRACAANETITELRSFRTEPEVPRAERTDGFSELDAEFERLRQAAQTQELLRPENEDEGFDALLETACRCLVEEKPPPDNVDAVVDVDFPGGKSFTPLHARIRMVYHDKQGLEKHYCLRALQKKAPRSYQARLRAAMTQSGIDRRLQFRHLVLFRTEPVPSGRITKQLTDEFHEKGGRMVHPEDGEIASLWALGQLEARKTGRFAEWLRVRQPVSRLRVMQEAKLCRAEGKNGDSNPLLDSGPPRDQSPSSNKGLLSPFFQAAPVCVSPEEPIPLGRRFEGGQMGDAVALPVEKLRQHAMVMAGAGSGKTVLLRRIVEEAALRGLPSIVIDGANDLSRLGDAWPAPPEAWGDGDAAMAGDYLANTEVVIWTPGYEGGNPLRLEPLPNFAAMRDAPDELEQALVMAREALRPIVAQGRSETVTKRLGVLAAVLERFAKNGGGSLAVLAELLADLPADCDAGITDARKLATKMADSLRATMQVDPLLGGAGTPLDPAVLFGLAGSGRKVRVSVLNFVGMAQLDQQRQFLNQLAMTLFTWIKQHPAPEGQALRGLLVIDEAKDFLPSRRESVCKDSLMRLAAQARKYGLGLVFATQAPKDIEHTVVSNCFTHVYGTANSPAAIAALQEQLKNDGGSGNDIARLGTGHFYVYNADVINPPVKVAAPLCLSHHPKSPPTPEDIQQRARECRARG